MVGIDKAKSGSIKILLDKKEIEEVRKLNQIDGKIYPESDFPDKEKILKGFDWREDEQLTSIEDLFKDDPPIVQPIIKGLDDYVPQEEFFDDAMLDRIEQADKQSDITNTEESKASRNLPKNIKDKTKLLKQKGD